MGRAVYLRDDPGELRNRFDDPDFADVRTAMMERLVQADPEREPTRMHREAGA